MSIYYVYCIAKSMLINQKWFLADPLERTVREQPAPLEIAFEDYFVDSQKRQMTYPNCKYIYSKTSFIGTPLKCKHLVYRDLEGLPTTIYSLMVGCHDSCCMLTFSNGNEGIYNTKVCKKIDIIKLLQIKHPQTMSLCTRSGGWRRNKMSRQMRLRDPDKWRSR